MQAQHFKGPCETRVTVFGPGFDGGFLLVQLPDSNPLGRMSPNIREARVKTAEQANRKLKQWKANFACTPKTSPN